MQRAGLPSPQPYGVAELTPEREYLIVFEFLDGATELGDATSTTRSSTRGWPSSASCGTPTSPTVHKRPTCWSAAASCT